MSEIELQDKILRHALQLLRLSAGEQAEVEEIMRQLEAELRQLLESRNLSAAARRELTAIIKEADAAIKAGYATAAQQTDTLAIAIQVAERTQTVIAEVIPATVAKPSAEVLRALTQDVLIEGAPSSAWWAKQAEDTAFRFAAQVRQGAVNGETNERIVQRIVGRRGEPGILEVSRRNARALVHSSVMSAANESRLATFRKNSRLIKGVRWLATLDGHTCARCAALDGAMWDLDGKPIEGTKIAFMAPPIHWNDRCILSPVPKTFRDIGLDIDEPEDAGMRASSLGPVKGTTTFQDYFGRLSAEQQNEQFGTGRARLFRSGKITVKDMVSGTGRELSLAELKE